MILIYSNASTKKRCGAKFDVYRYLSLHLKKFILPITWTHKILCISFYVYPHEKKIPTFSVITFSEGAIPAFERFCVKKTFPFSRKLLWYTPTSAKYTLHYTSDVFGLDFFSRVDNLGNFSYKLQSLIIQ